MSNWVDANPYLTYYTFPSGAKAYHTGADLNLNTPTWNADKGMPVHAIGNGVVIYARLVPTGTWGRLVVVRHMRPNGQTIHSRYGHLASLAVKEEQIVIRGDILGTIGGTEYNVPDHLHFDVSTSGILESNPTHWPGTNKAAVIANYVDPKAFLAQFVSVTPPGNAVDMAAYFFPAAGGFGDIAILKNNWGAGDERQQLQRLGDISYVTKNSKWERRRITTTGVFLEMDTSPNEQEYYKVEGQWLPRYWRPGDTFTRTEKVSYYYSHNCQPSRAPYTTASSIRFESLTPVWTSPAGVKLSNVIELAWVLKGVVEERYWFAPGLGLVMWQNKEGKHSWITQLIPQGQQGNNVRQIIGCSSVS
jgi:hypothetical protein